MPGSLGCAAKDHHRPAIEIIKAGVRNLGLEKISDQPCFNALQFANLYRLFDLVKFGASAAENDSVDGIFVQHLDQPLHRQPVQIQFSENLDRFIGRFKLELVSHLGGFLTCADQDKAPAVLRLGQFALGSQPHQFFLHKNQNETDAAKPDHHPARNHHLGQEQNQNQAESH